MRAASNGSVGANAVIVHLELELTIGASKAIGMVRVSAGADILRLIHSLATDVALVAGFGRSERSPDLCKLGFFAPLNYDATVSIFQQCYHHVIVCPLPKLLHAMDPIEYPILSSGSADASERIERICSYLKKVAKLDFRPARCPN